MIANRCGIPWDASAVAANVTVAAPSAAGALRVFPGIGVAPIATSISFKAGVTRANNLLAGIGEWADSSSRYNVSILNDSPGSTHVILDVSGYFRPTGSDPLCYTIQDLNPGVAKVDMLDWLTMDPDLRSSNHLVGPISMGIREPMCTDLRSDRFYLIKKEDGTVWDISLYDDNFIYLYGEATRWGDPTYFRLATLRGRHEIT